MNSRSGSFDQIHSRASLSAPTRETPLPPADNRFNIAGNICFHGLFYAYLHVNLNENVWEDTWEVAEEGL